MTFKIITVFPELIQNYLSDAILSKAIAKDLLKVDVISLREFSSDKYKSVDDSPYGGGDGMVMRADILEKAFLTIQNKQKRQLIVYLSPQGKLLQQNDIKPLTEQFDEIILICGRYAGIDQRFIDKYVDREISIGDYVLNGGELPALVLIEALARGIPGVLGNDESFLQDSLTDGWLEAPQYTRPAVWNELEVPGVLTSGDHGAIKKWKQEKSLEMTHHKRPDLLSKLKGKL